MEFSRGLKRRFDWTEGTMDWERIREKWREAHGLVRYWGSDYPGALLEVANEIPAEYKQQFTAEIVNGVEYLGRAVLHDAAGYGRFKCVKYLVEELNADVNVRSSELAGTPLHWATGDDDRMNIMRYLIEKCGADVNAVDGNGWTPLHYAACKNAEIAVSYLSLYCDISITSKREYDSTLPGSTALQVAEAVGSEAALKCLKFATATSVEDLIGPPTSNMAKYYLIMRYLKGGGYTINKFPLPLDVLSSGSYLPTYDEAIDKELRGLKDSEMLMCFITLVDVSMVPERNDDLVLKKRKNPNRSTKGKRMSRL